MAAPIGSTARTNELLGGKFFDESTGAAVKPFVPTSADQITNVASPQMPSESPKFPDLAGVNGRTQFYKTQSDFYMKEAERLDAERAKQAESPIAKASDQFEATAIARATDPQYNPATIRRENEEITGINPKEYFANQKASLAELEGLNEDYNATVAERDAALEARRTQGGGLTSGTDTALTKIERDYAIRLNQKAANIKSKAALMEAREGNFKEAQSFIRDAVNDATADTKYALDLFTTFYNKNEAQIEKLDSKYSDALKSALTSAEESYESEYSEKLKVGELMLKYPEAGLSLDTSLEDAFSNISEGIANGTITTESETSSNGFADIMQQAIDAGATPEQAAREAATASELAGIQVDQKTLNAWVSQAKKLKKTVVPEPETVAPTSRGGLFSNFFSKFRSTKGAQPRPITVLNNLQAPNLNTQDAFFSNLFQK